MLRAVILIVTFVVVSGNECNQRSFGEDRIVCVCNSTYCDTISDPPELQANQFMHYISTKSGQRLELSVSSFSTEPDEEISLTMDSTQKFQVIDGFGGAMTDAAALNIRRLSNETQQKLLESYFGSNGTKYTYCRIPIAGTDFSTRPYTYDDTPGDLTLSKFSLVEEDNYKIGYLHQIKNMMPDPDSLRIFTTAWSAPAWMKTSNKITTGSLKLEYYQLYADYIKMFFDEYKDQDIDIWGITPGNEPIDGLFPFFSFNAMYWSPENAASWTSNYLYPTLSKAGYNLIYMAMDDQRFELPRYVDSMFNNNKKAEELFHGIAYHWYFDGVSSPMRLTETHNKYPDKFILMTEACTGSFSPSTEKVILGSWERGQFYIEDIIENLSHWVTGWVDWNIALDEYGAPNWAKNNVDSPIIVMPQNDEFYKQPMYYALFHVSAFVPRGSYRIFLTGLENIQDIKAVALLTPKQEIVIIVVNKADQPYNVTIKDKNVSSKKINLYTPAHSFNTIVYSSEQ